MLFVLLDCKKMEKRYQETKILKIQKGDSYIYMLEMTENLAPGILTEGNNEYVISDKRREVMSMSLQQGTTENSCKDLTNEK